MIPMLVPLGYSTACSFEHISMNLESKYNKKNAVEYIAYKMSNITVSYRLNELTDAAFCSVHIITAGCP